jgi:hypothetical protein
MPGMQPPELLRVEPGAIPAVRAAFDEALAELGAHLLRLRQQAVIPEPWLADRVSVDTQVFYQQRVVESADGALAAMGAYEAELIRIRDTLKAMEDGYVRNEGNVAGLVRPIP